MLLFRSMEGENEGLMWEFANLEPSKHAAVQDTLKILSEHCTHFDEADELVGISVKMMIQNNNSFRRSQY